MRRIFLCAILMSGLLFGAVAQSISAELVFGIIPRRPAPTTQKMFKPLIDEISSHIGSPIRIVYSKNFDLFLNDIQSENFDFAHVGISHYLTAKKHNYRLLAKNEEFGKSTITSVLYVRKDSGISTLADLKGKTIVFGGDQQSLIPYVGPTYLLWKNGLQPSDYRGQVAQNPYNAVYAVHKRAGDAGCAADITLNLENVKGKIETDELAILAKLGPFPHLPWIASKRIDSEMFIKIQNFLLNLDKSEKGKKLLENAKLTNIVPVQESEYLLVEEVISSFKKIAEESEPEKL